MEGESPKDSRKNLLDSAPSYTQVVQAPPEKEKKGSGRKGFARIVNSLRMYEIVATPPFSVAISSASSDFKSPFHSLSTPTPTPVY